MQEARAKPLADVGPPTKEEKDNGSVTTNTGRGVDYTLRRLARDAPEMLDKIEAGEMLGVGRHHPRARTRSAMAETGTIVLL